MTLRFLCGLLALALASFGAQADIYQFDDGSGPIFSDRAGHPGSVLVLAERNEDRQPARTTLRQRTATAPGRLRHSSTPFIDGLIDRAAANHGLDAQLLHAIVQVESAYDSHAVSAKGAGGLMQLMPATARMHGVRDVLDPMANIEGGARHLRQLIDRHRGDLALALAAYNAGEGSVRRYGGVPPFAETRRYVPEVLERLARLRAAAS